MEKVLVKVKDIPVRYDKVTYYKGDTFEMLSSHVSNSIVEVMGELSEEQSPVTYEHKPLSLNKEGLKALSLDGLKDYAKEFGIELGRAKSKDSIIEKILKVQG